MNAFDRVIGYEDIKQELRQICDMLRNREKYEKLGAKLPRGIILYGEPGLGKTLLAQCLMEESGLQTEMLRRKGSSEDFEREITKAFEKAREQTPSILLLDDLDKFANDDFFHCDSSEFVAVQTEIDECAGMDVLVVATVNELHKLPDSLCRTGRFDYRIHVRRPHPEEADKIIAHYLADKPLAEDVSVDDLVRMISYHSCADMEMIINEAAIHAAFAGKVEIGMEDMIQAVLRKVYGIGEGATTVDLRKVAFHEAGHAVVSEALCPGSVGLVSVRRREISGKGGFVYHCKQITALEPCAIISLAGKAATELFLDDSEEDGCLSDMNCAAEGVRELMSDYGEAGMGLLNVATGENIQLSECMNARVEAVTQAELERLMRRARRILVQNKELVENMASTLMEKETLLYSDVQKLVQEMPAAGGLAA